MMTVFAAAIDDLFADPNLACDAFWRAGGNDPAVPVRVIARRPDSATLQFEVRASLPAMIADVRASEVAQPVEGDRLTIGAATYVVRKAEADGEGLIWRLDLDPLA